MNRRFITPISQTFAVREETEGEKRIEGYFAVFGGRYDIYEDGYETIDVGAFDDALDDDIRALINHDTTLVLGRTTAGTLELRIDDHGLWGSILINEADQDAMNVYERVKRGDVSQCSFGFDILGQNIEITKKSDGSDQIVWHIQKVKLYEVSVCTFPAYDETAVEARKSEGADIRRKRTEAWREKMLQKLKGDH